MGAVESSLASCVTESKNYFRNRPGLVVGLHCSMPPGMCRLKHGVQWSVQHLQKEREAREREAREREARERINRFVCEARERERQRQRSLAKNAQPPRARRPEIWSVFLLGLICAILGTHASNPELFASVLKMPEEVPGDLWVSPGIATPTLSYKITHARARSALSRTHAFLHTNLQQLLQVVTLYNDTHTDQEAATLLAEAVPTITPRQAKKLIHDAHYTGDGESTKSESLTRTRSNAHVPRPHSQCL